MARHYVLIGRIRFLTMALTAGICLIYALLVLVSGKPDPISPWWPGAFGAATAIIIFLSFRVAGTQAADMAMDERYVVQDGLAHRIGYWSALFMYPLFGALMALDLIPYYLVFPLMGCLTAAAYLIPQVILTGWER
ncbi:MAG: hypothetical protein AAF530_05030 [Pseudomonadota bacterium]